jgi:hypothetical protein
MMHPDKQGRCGVVGGVAATAFTKHSSRSIVLLETQRAAYVIKVLQTTCRLTARLLKLLAACYTITSLNLMSAAWSSRNGNALPSRSMDRSTHT